MFADTFFMCNPMKMYHIWFNILIVWLSLAILSELNSEELMLYSIRENIK